MSDAEKYGFGIHRMDGAIWRVAEARHLTPEENKGRHNVFVDAIDDQGQRVTGAMLWWGDTGGVVGKMSMDKPAGEPMCNVPVWSGQMVYVSMGDNSESVVGLHTMHGDELGPNGEIWNSNGHHSFYIKFQKAGAVAVKKVCQCCGREL